MKYLETSPDVNRPPRAAKLVATTKRIGQVFGKLMESSLNVIPNQWDGVVDGLPAATPPLSQPATLNLNSQLPEIQAAPSNLNQG